MYLEQCDNLNLAAPFLYTQSLKSTSPLKARMSSDGPDKVEQGVLVLTDTFPTEGVALAPRPSETGVADFCHRV